MTGTAKNKGTNKGTSKTTAKAAQEEAAAWSVLVYMAGDNNLTEEMAWGLQELKKTAARLEERPNLSNADRINVVAHFDPRGSRSRRYDFAPSTTRVPLPQARRDGNLHDYEAMIYTRRDGDGQGSERRSERAAALATPLGAFVRDQIARLPTAKRHFLILSGHGSGAVGDFLVDSDPTTSLSIPQLARILDATRTEYARSSNGYKGSAGKQDARPRIDILGMDSCLMSNAEVCYEIHEHADLLVASEGWVANAGWPYHRVLEACLLDESKANTNPTSVAKRVADNYTDFYRDYEIAGISTDIAVCKLEAFRDDRDESLVARLQGLSRVCIEAFDAVFVEDVRSRTVSDEKRARAVVTELGGQIARLLCQSESDRKSLSTKLARGSEAALEQLTKSPNFDELSSSQVKAVRELLESMGGAYGIAGKDLETQALDSWGRLFEVLSQPASPSMALAAVRLLREFDPGVLEALKMIEEQERKGRHEAKQARVILQKLHQVLWVLELNKLAKYVKQDGAHVQLLNAVVASRWHAQSFKAGVYVDLLDLSLRLEERLHEPKARRLCKRVGDAASRAVVPTPLHTGAASQHANGLSVYFPCQTVDYAPEYDNLGFAKKTGWGRLVRAYLRATRRERRDEERHWAKAADRVVRFGHSEVDPLEADGIEARIVGVIAPIPRSGQPEKTNGKEGTSTKIREGTSTKIREGTATKIREGTSAKIRGEGALFVWGNPPDGFFREAENAK